MIRIAVFVAALYFAALVQAEDREVNGQATQPAPTDIQTVYIAPMSHTDIGFTAPPREVAEGAGRHTQQAIELARKDPDYVWNVEVFWELEQWLDPQKSAGLSSAKPISTRPAPSQREVNDLIDLVRRGRFGIGAAYANPHTSLMSAWTLDQLFRLPTQWARGRGLNLDWAVINDVPGHPPDLPKFLAANQIKYLLLGVNQGLSKPLPHEVCNAPFWWEAPDGSRVLTWIDKGAYTSAWGEYGVDPGTARFFNHKEFSQEQPLETIRYGMRKLMDSYRKHAYPYDSVLIMHAFDNWDASAAGRLPAAVRLWNESGGKPRLVLAAPDRFFKHIEAKYGSQLPVRRGGFGGQWELIRTTHPSAIARARAREAELLAAAQPPTLDDIRRLLVFWEHSYALSTPWPDYLTREKAIEQNEQEWGMVADWPMPKALPRTDKTIQPLVEATVGPFQSNGLCLADTTFIVWKDFRPMPKEAWIHRAAEPLPGGGVRCRQQIDRRKLPDPANVIWAWKLNEEQATAPVIIQTATGTTRWPADGLGGYSQFHWVAPWGFQIGSTRFVPHGPFAFARPPEYPGWLLCYVLSQGRTATLRGGQKVQMGFEEVFQGEEPIYEFVIDIELVATASGR